VALELLCRKLGMTRVFTDSGECIPVTALEAGPNAIVQKKTPERDGYAALQLGFGERRAATLQKPRLGHFQKAAVSPRRWLRECRVSAEDLEAREVGGEIGADIFEAGQRVDVVGVSKGRGTAGTVRRHGFRIKRRTHGTHEGFRRPGAIGAGASPGRVWKGQGMFGRMGSERVTTRNVEVVQVDPERGVILLRGAAPGHNGGLVILRPAAAPK